MKGKVVYLQFSKRGLALLTEACSALCKRNKQSYHTGLPVVIVDDTTNNNHFCL